MTGTAKIPNLSQPSLISALLAEIAKQRPHSNVNNAQFVAIVEAANHVIFTFSRDSGDAL